MEFTKQTLDQYRNVIADETSAKSIQKIIKAINKKHPVRIEEPELKKIPKGFESTEVTEALLRRKGLACWYDLPLDDALYSKKAVTFILSRFKNLNPINEWIDSL